MDEILIIASCLVLNAIFAAYEMAFVAVPKAELRKMARKGHRHAQKLLQLRDNPERTLSIIQIGITLVGAVAAAVGGAGASEVLEPYFIHEWRMKELTAEVLSVVLVVLPITYLSVVIGELVPKSLALRSPLKIVLAGAPALSVADRILAPLIHVLETSTKLILTLVFRKSREMSSQDTTTIEIDGLSPAHRNFVLNMAEIEKKLIKDIMLPWSEVIGISIDANLEDVTQTVLGSGHTRLPVLDQEGVVGILHTKEFVVLKESGETKWQTLIRPAINVRLQDSALGVMRLMQDRHSRMAIVYAAPDERVGIVTMEDIFEEIVGEIFDEDDDGKVRRLFVARARNRPRPRL